MQIPRPPLFLAATLGIFTVSLVMSLIVFISKTSPAPDSFESEFVFSGHASNPKSESILTMIVMPKALGRSKNGNSHRQMRFIIESWARLSQVDFIVVSRDPETLQIVSDLGIASVQPTNENDVENLTYRAILKMVDRTLPIQTAVVGFSNGDILFDETLPETVLAVTTAAKNHGWANFAIEGQRTNVDIPNFLLNGRHQSQIKQRFQKGTLFQDDAQVCEETSFHYISARFPIFIGLFHIQSWYQSGLGLFPSFPYRGCIFW